MAIHILKFMRITRIWSVLTHVFFNCFDITFSLYFPQYYLDPPSRLNEELRKQGLSEMQFFLLKHGESRLIEIKEADKEHHADHTEGVDHEHHVVNGLVHLEIAADTCTSDDDKHESHVECAATEDDHSHGAKVEITTTETVITEGGSVHLSEHTETHSEGFINDEGETVLVHTETVHSVDNDGDISGTLTIDDIPCMDGDEHEEGHDYHEDQNKHEDDNTMLQNLVDQFVDETQSDHHEY